MPGAAVGPRLPAAARVALYLLAFVVIESVVGAVVVVPAALVGGGPRTPEELLPWLLRHPALLVGWNWLRLAATLGLTAVFVVGLDRRSWSSVGFAARPAAGAQVGVGFLLGGALWATVFGVGWLAGWFRVVGALPAGRVPVLVFGSLAVLVPAAAVEEVSMRGYVLQALESRYGTRWALGLSAVIFALLHGANPNADRRAMAGLVVAGVYLGAAYLLTRRLWLPIAVHTAWNFFEGPVFGFAVSGLRLPTTILQTETHGPELWTGGAFGPEAGLLLALGILAHLVVLAWATRLFRVAAVGVGGAAEGPPPEGEAGASAVV